MRRPRRDARIAFGILYEQPGDALGAERAFDAIRRERQLAQPHASERRDGVADRAATSGTPSSPAPVGLLSVDTTLTSMLGTSDMRIDLVVAGSSTAGRGRP